GIRDWSVTGVQTCALPISMSLIRPRSSGSCDAHERATPEPGGAAVDAVEPRRRRRTALSCSLALQSRSDLDHRHRSAERSALHRSEERRVGKEGEAQWWPG